jgi:pimeloyl-ACP methyl ester carboxylesterase
MGSLIALEAAGMESDAPDRVLGLVLVGTAWPMRVTPALLQMARHDPARAIEVISGYTHARREPALMQGSTTMMGEVLSAGQYQPAPTAEPALNLLEHDLALCDGYRDGFETAARIRCRSAIIAGRMDRMTPADQALGLAEALGAPVDILDGVGHTMMHDNPHGFAAALIRALETVSPGQPE